MDNEAEWKLVDPSPLLTIDETHLDCWIQSWVPHFKRDMDIKRAQKRVAIMAKGLTISNIRRNWEIVQLNLEKRRLWRNLFYVCKYLKGRCKEDRARLFSVVPCSRTSGNGDKLKYRKVHQNTKRQFCFVRVVKYWHIRFREVLKSPFS